MRAITVRQPWAWAIIHGGKDVENRTRNIAGTYRGPLAIHAGLTDDRHAPPVVLASWRNWWHEQLEQGLGQRGHIIGVVDLVDVCASTWEQMDADQAVCCLSPWKQMPPEGDTIYHLHLRDPRPLLEPVPYRGALGLWRLPDDVALPVQEVLL